MILTVLVGSNMKNPEDFLAAFDTDGGITIPKYKKENCMLVDKIQAMLADAIGNRDESRKPILKVLVSEIQRLHGEVKDNQVIGIVKKMVESNKAMLLQVDEAKKSVLLAENVVLEDLLPKLATKEVVMLELQKIRDNFVGRADGECMSMAMAHFKANGIAVDGKLVKNCVDEVRT